VLSIIQSDFTYFDDVSNMVYDPKNSNIELFYEDGVYTVSINLAEDGFIVTDGRTFDELMKNMQDAFECHFYEA
jgi:hypothetical protein